MQPDPGSMVRNDHVWYYDGKEHTGAGDGLSISLVLNITAGENTRKAGVAGTGLGEDVAVLVEVNLALDEGSGRVVADGVEEAIGANDLLVARDGVLDSQMGQQAHGLVFTQGLEGNSVETDGDLGVSEETVGHGLASTQLMTANQHGNAAAILGQEHGLLGGRVATSDHVERLVTEDRHGAVANSAGADSVLPVFVLTGQVETAGVGAGGDDDGVGGTGGSIVGAVVVFRPHLEGALRKVQLRNGLRDDLGAEAGGLLAHALHQLGSVDAVREAREVLNVRGGGQLAAGGGAVRQHALVENGTQFRPREINCSSVCSGAGPDNWRGEMRSVCDTTFWPKSIFHLFYYLLTTLLCTILDAEVELTRTGVVRGWDRTEAGGADFWCKDDAAAAVNPRDDRRDEKGKRRKIDENSLTVGREEDKTERPLRVGGRMRLFQHQ